MKRLCNECVWNIGLLTILSVSVHIASASGGIGQLWFHAVLCLKRKVCDNEGVAQSQQNSNNQPSH